MRFNPLHGNDTGVVCDLNSQAMFVAPYVKDHEVFGEEARAVVAIPNFLWRFPDVVFGIGDPILDPPSSVRVSIAICMQ